MNAEKENRNRLIYEMRKRGVPLASIGRELNLHVATVSQVARRWKKREEQKDSEQEKVMHTHAP